MHGREELIRLILEMKFGDDPWDLGTFFHLIPLHPRLILKNI